MKSVDLRLGLGIVFLSAAATALAQVPVTSGPAPAKPSAHPPSTPASVTLYTQDDNSATVATSSQDFETAFDGFDDEGADDFVVPPGTFWTVQGVHVMGQYFNGAGPAPTVHVHFYADAAGVPGGSVCDYIDVVPTDTTGTFDIALPSPCALGPGTYWVSVIAHMDFGAGGQWGWQDRTVQSNGASVWRNPANGFGTSCSPSWGLKTACVVGSGVDFVFSLSGSAGGVIPPAPQECGSSTTFFNNNTPVAIADNSVATSTINVTGAGSFVWDLNLQTFIRHTFPGDLDITITSPAGTVVTLTTDNGGTSDDAFNGTVWDDQADPGSQVPYSGSPNLVTDHTYAISVLASPLVPEEALGAFTGENPNGTWTLTISDDAGGDTGTLDAWAMQVTTLDSAPTILISNSFGNATPVPIVDNSVATSTVSVSGLGTRICGLMAQTNITHTFPGDIDMTLMSPAGTIVTLTTDNGGTNDDVFNGTEWNDDANPGGQVPYGSNDGLVTDQLYVLGVPATPLVPEEAMSAFLGENPTGIWTLTVSDDATGDTGTLNSWSLNVLTCSCAIAEPVALRVDEHAGSGSTGDLNGVFETGETVQVEPEWMNPGSSSFDLLGLGQTFNGPVGPTYTFVDNFANYGTVAPLASANCYDTTGDCFGVQVTGSRPLQHWDAALAELGAPFAAPAGGPTYNKSWSLHIGESFPDVPKANLFYKFIENIFHNGITGGCAGGNYCPDNSVTRAQMAVFLLKSEHGSSYVPPACAGVFPDVACPSLFADWIEQLFAEGITGGCGGGNYCPGNAVTRQQMAAFLLKAEHGSGYTPPSCAGVFGDVACPSLFADWIERLAAEGITTGCGGGNYCPTNPNTRGQMAVFLVKTFGLLLYGL